MATESEPHANAASAPPFTCSWASERSERAQGANTNREPAADQAAEPAAVHISNPWVAIQQAAPSACPNAPSRYCWDLVSGRVVQMSCKSWACSRCSFWKKSAAYRALLEGVEQALARDEWVRFFTLTAPAAGMTVREVYECFNRLRAALRRISKARPDPRLREYAAVLEWQERGEPHLHVIATGEFIPQAELSRLAAAAGFGPIADIRAVGGPGYAAGERAEDEDGMTAAEAAAWYLAKYLAKAEQEALTRAAADPEVSRVRPVRFSRRWGCSMSAAAALLRREWLESKGVDPDEPCEWVLLDVDAERGEVRAFNAGRRIGNMELLLLIDSLEYDRELGAELWRSWPERSVPRPPDPPPPKYEQQVLALGLRPTGGRTSPW